MNGGDDETIGNKWRKQKIRKTKKKGNLNERNTIKYITRERWIVEFNRNEIKEKIIEKAAQVSSVQEVKCERWTRVFILETFYTRNERSFSCYLTIAFIGNGKAKRKFNLRVNK